MNGIDWSGPTVLPTDAQVDAAAKPLPGAHVLDLHANPLRTYLEAIAVELLIAKGEARHTWKHALALALEHSYGRTPGDAQDAVEQCVQHADKLMKADAAAGLSWEEIKDESAGELVDGLLR